MFMDRNRLMAYNLIRFCTWDENGNMEYNLEWLRNASRKHYVQTVKLLSKENENDFCAL